MPEHADNYFFGTASNLFIALRCLEQEEV